MEFVNVEFRNGCQVSLGGKIIEGKMPAESGYWVEYWPKHRHGVSPVFVGPFISESDALTSGLDHAEFKRVICNPMPPLNVQAIYHRDSTTLYGLMSADGWPNDWGSWGKAFGSIEARDRWLLSAGFTVSEEIENMPVEWSRKSS